jgi:heme/copper-type cytochrome/quinol oxidase subunit 2
VAARRHSSLEVNYRQAESSSKPMEDPIRPPVTPQQAPSVHDGLAITSFVLAFIMPVLGFTLGCVSLSTARRDHRQASGLAVAAITLSVIFALIAVITVIVVVAHGTAAPACDPTNPTWPYC